MQNTNEIKNINDKQEKNAFSNQTDFDYLSESLSDTDIRRVKLYSNRMEEVLQSKNRKGEQYFKFLFIVPPTSKDGTITIAQKKDLIEKMDNIKRRRFDVVFILGDVDEVLLLETATLFDNALVLQLPRSYFLKKRAEELFVMNFHKKRQRIASSHLVGFGNGSKAVRDLPIPIGNILITNKEPSKSKKIQEYIQNNTLDFVFYPGENMKQTISGNTVFVGVNEVCPLVVPNPEFIAKKLKSKK